MSPLLSENIKNLRTAKGLSQEELAARLNVVRQTVSKWEKGLSVPDADLLTALSAALETPVHILLGEPEGPGATAETAELARRLEELNAQFALQKEKARKRRRLLFLLLGCVAAVILLGEVSVFLHLWHTSAEAREGISIIGGADGPTAIFLSRLTINPITVFVTLIALIIAGVGLYTNRRKIQK